MKDVTLTSGILLYIYISFITVAFGNGVQLFHISKREEQREKMKKTNAWFPSMLEQTHKKVVELVCFLFSLFIVKWWNVWWTVHLPHNIRLLLLYEKYHLYTMWWSSFNGKCCDNLMCSPREIGIFPHSFCCCCCSVNPRVCVLVFVC